MRHIIDSKEFDRTFVEQLFESAFSLRGVRNENLKGKILVSLFFEPSTRTRLSFESAMLRLGGNVISVENAKEFSSSIKGESLEDTIRVSSNYGDIIVMRHYENGAAAVASSVASVPIVNAGDGSGEHPTQALVDAYTIHQELSTLDGIHIAFVGDVMHSRSIRSLAQLMSIFSNVHMTFVSPKSLSMSPELKEILISKKVTFEEMNSLDSVIAEADVIYQNRVQKERFEKGESYSFDASFVMSKESAARMKNKSIVLNPLPRVGELLPEVDALPQAAYFKAAKNAVEVRMALIKSLLS